MVGDTSRRLFAVLTCIPEPRRMPGLKAVARGRERYDRLIKSAGRSTVGDARVALQELTSNVSQV